MPTASVQLTHTQKKYLECVAGAIDCRTDIIPESAAHNQELLWLLQATEGQLAALLHKLPDNDDLVRPKLQKAGENRFDW